MMLVYSLFLLIYTWDYCYVFIYCLFSDAVSGSDYSVK
jgi:hypothetical protein